jgi:hypothetical protein
VYVQGTKQASTAYAYDSVTGIITFSGEYPDEGDEVQIINGTLINSIDIATADDVEYTPAGGTATTVASKLEEYVSVSDYCLCDGSDEVTELQKAIDQDKPVYLASDKEVAINGTLYFGHHRIFGGGTIKVIGDVNWTAAGSATRAATSGILPKAADNSIYPETTQKINIDGIKIILEKTDSGACHVGLRMENIGSGTILADIRTTGSTQNNSHALDLYQNNFNIIVDGYYESGVLGEVDGLTSVRNVGAGESSGNIVMRGIYKTLAENEAFGVYNVNGQTGTTMRGVVVDGCLILGQHKGFAWINNTSEDYDDFSGCVISNSTIVVEDIDDGGWGYAEENVGAAVSNVHVIIRSSTGAGMTNCYGFWARSWDGNRPKPKLTNCSVTVDNALTSDVLWGYSGFADLHNCGAYGDHFKFTLKTLNGTVNGGDFANGSTACVSGVTNITGNAILRGKVHNVTNDIDGVTFLLDSSVISGSNLIEVTAATTAINRKRLRFNAYLTGSSTPTRIIACSNTVQQVFDVDYYLQYPATYAPANADNLALATNLLQMYEVIWNDGTTSTRKAQAATI